MQQSRRPVQRQSRFSSFFGSRLMILLLAVAVIIVALFLFRATRASSPPPAPTAVPATAHATNSKHHVRVTHRAKPVPPKPAKKPLTAAQLRARAMNQQRKRYAARIVPVLDRSRVIFNGTARAAASSSGNLNTLQQTCSYWGSKVQTIESEYDGIPHQFLWWTPAGTLHHQVSGTYHYMLGAIQNCQEAVKATDSGGVADALSQMATAAGNIQDRENVARYFATH